MGAEAEHTMQRNHFFFRAMPHQGALRPERLKPVLAILGSLLGGLSLSGCGRDNGGFNPVGWWHDLKGGAIAGQRPPPPGVDQPYGNFASVPPRPVMPTQAERDKIAGLLAAARSNAEYQAKTDPLPSPNTPSPQGGDKKATAGKDSAAPSNQGKKPSSGSSPNAPASAEAPAGKPDHGTATANRAPPPAAAPSATDPAAEDSGISANMEGATAKPPATPAAPPPANVSLAQAVKDADKPFAADAGITRLPNQPYQSKLANAGPAPSIPNAPPPPPNLSGVSVPLRGPTPHPTPPVAPPGPPVLLKGAALQLTPVAFSAGSAVINRDATLVINAYALKHAGQNIVAIGFGEALNTSLTAQSDAMKLALERARSITLALERAGIPASHVRMEAEPLGTGGAVRLTN
ncbi:Hypothetical protein GbCGDNIH6_1433 [Granulibacter bethesdensis]|nr:Hypothetical protein GbCGDNIH6_1433 [Granulibacter bethesdensis]